MQTHVEWLKGEFELMNRQMSSRDKQREVTKSWWCQPCGQEVYSLRCKYCGKSESEES